MISFLNATLKSLFVGEYTAILPVNDENFHNSGRAWYHVDEITNKKEFKAWKKIRTTWNNVGVGRGVTYLNKVEGRLSFDIEQVFSIGSLNITYRQPTRCRKGPKIFCLNLYSFV